MITKTFESASSDAVYTAQFDPATGETSCTCPGWRFKRAGGRRTCKHVVMLATVAAQAATPGSDSGELFPAAPAPAESVRAPRVVPMLASAMTKTRLSDHMNDAWFLEEKFDGQRVMIRKVGQVVDAWSRPRAGKEPLTCDLITPALLAAIRTLPDGLFDGELVVPGGRSWTVARLDQAVNRRIVIFDVLEVMGESATKKTATERHALTDLVVAHHRATWAGDPLILSTTIGPVTEESVQAIWDRGGEGAILKRKTSTYQPGKRSADWVKVKQSGSAVLTIIGFERGKASSSTPFSVTRLRRDDGLETTVTTLNNATVADVAKDPSKYIGQRLVIKYTELTDSGTYRHGGWDHLAGVGE